MIWFTKNIGTMPRETIINIIASWLVAASIVAVPMMAFRAPTWAWWGTFWITYFILLNAGRPQRYQAKPHDSYVLYEDDNR